MQQIQDISERATKEWNLEKALDKMQQEWRTISFELGPLRETFILREVDAVQQVLDDHIVKTQGMRGSPFVKPFEDRVVTWDQKLLSIQDILDEWLRCQVMCRLVCFRFLSVSPESLTHVNQVTYMYLEPIFSSEDIMRQLPVEGKAFQEVNLFWQSTMALCSKNPLVTGICGESHVDM